MVFFIGTGTSTLTSVTGSSPGGSGTSLGQSFYFGSLDFITDIFFKLHIYNSVPRQSVEASSPLPLGSTPKPETSAIFSLKNTMTRVGSLHGSKPFLDEHELWLVTMLESLLPVLSYNTDDGDESSSSHHPSHEIFMANQGVAAVDNNSMTQIPEKTPEVLKVTHLWLQEEHERLNEQCVELTR